jgi:hypothetical protein
MLLLMVERVIVAVLSAKFQMPPPALPALLLTVQSASVIVPMLGGRPFTGSPPFAE